jgi:hypothetical protein
MKIDNLHAVLDEDVTRVLAELGQLQSMESGDILCHECGTPIALKNLQIIVPMLSGEYRFVCDRTDCVESYLSKQERT